MKSYVKTKRIAAMLMAFILTLMMGTMAVFAADANGDGFDDESGQPINPTPVPSIEANGAHVSKLLRYNEGQTFDLTFSYTAQPTQVILMQTYDGTAIDETVMSQPSSACPAVTISDINVVADTNTTYNAAGLRVPKENMSDPELAANTYGVITFGSGAATGAAAFPHAGVFAYTISETAGLATGLNGNTAGTDAMTYDDQTYTMRVYVTNGNNGLEISNITMENANDEKVSRAGVLFNNTYTQTADTLEVKKVIAGDIGDTTKDFNFTVTFTAPSPIATMPNGSTWNPAAITVSKKDASGSTVQTSVTVGADGVASFTLKHNEEMVFGNLPVGASYVVSETGLAGTGYTPTGQAVQNGQTRSAHVGTRDTDYTSDPATVGLGENKYTITNTAEDITITGLVINNLPIIMLVVLAVAGVFGYRAMRRKMMAR